MRDKITNIDLFVVTKIAWYIRLLLVLILAKI